MPGHLTGFGQATPQRGLVPLPQDRAPVPADDVSPPAPRLPPAHALTDPMAIPHSQKAPNGDSAPVVDRGGSMENAWWAHMVKRGHRGRTKRHSVICLLLLLGIAAVLTPALRTAWRAVGGAPDGGLGRHLGAAFGAILLEGGLPPSDPLFGLVRDPDGTESTSAPTGDTETGRTPDRDPASTRDSEAVQDPTAPDTAPSDLPEDPEDTLREPSPDESTYPSEEEPPAVEPPEEGSYPLPSDSGDEETDTGRHPPAEGDDGAARETAAPPLNSDGPDTESVGETGRDEGGSDDGKEPVETGKNDDPTDPTEPGDPPQIPAGCYPLVSLDCSESTRGAGYIHNEAGILPDALPGGALWTQGTPAVLIVHTHPYEGFSEGGDYYDPASGALGVTDSPNDPDGVVALGARLARALRGQGVTVLHLRVAVTPGETTDAIYARTAALVRYYCRLYPDIGLVLDLRRCAEMTVDGGVLRTAGTCRGETVAQLGLSVAGGRPTSALARDLAAALFLRACLWAMEPTLSRPVSVRRGDGLAGAAGLDPTTASPAVGTATAAAPILLTVEFGSAGNTFSEATALVAPLAEAVGELVRGK